jgi:hypothetical protein
MALSKAWSIILTSGSLPEKSYAENELGIKF